MNEEEKKTIKIVNSLKEWGKIHFIVKDRSYARLTYNEVYLLLNLIEKLQKENEELKNNEVIDENGFEFAVDCDWDRLKRLIDTADKGEEFILYNNEKWIKEKYCIPIQKVKDKIEYLEDYIEENSDEQRYWGNINPDVIYRQIEILEELLKEEK